MTDAESVDNSEAVELYIAADEMRLTLQALHDRGVKPETEPDLWANLKGAIENARTRATTIPAFDAVLDDGVADTPEEFLAQIETLDEEAVRNAAEKRVDA